MAFQRRRLLQILSFSFGSSLLPGRLGASEASGQSPLKQEPEATPRETVTGIGGLFFRAHDPKALALWYEQHLGVLPTPTSYGGAVWQQEAGPTVFAAFGEKSGYFGDATKDWMVNFRVRDLDRMAAQLQAAGIAVKVDPEHYPNGRFARLHDPEGNPIELWQPVTPKAKG